MLGPETRAPVVPGHQDVDDDEADGEDGQHAPHGYGHQHLHLTVLVDQELQGVRLLAQTILDVHLVVLTVLSVRCLDEQSGDVAAVVGGELVQLVSAVLPVTRASGQPEMLHLPLNIRPGFSTHLHLDAGVRPCRGLEPGLGVKIQSGRSPHLNMHWSRVSDALLAAYLIVSVADVLPVILEDDVVDG